MTTLILGLLLFIGVHSIGSLAPGWRDAQIAARGMKLYRAVYSLLTLLALVLIVWGYGQSRLHPIDLWSPPIWLRHLSSLLTLVAFVLVAAAYVPRNRLKAAIGHPMTAGIKAWALAHLLSNGRLADVLLFGSFMVWAAMVFAIARRRDRAAGVSKSGSDLFGNGLTILAGLGGWAVFAFWLHGPLIGVRPFS